MFSDKENQSPVKDLGSKSCIELGQLSKPYSLQTSMEESSSKTGFRLSPASAAAVTGFQQPVFTSSSFHGQVDLYVYDYQEWSQFRSSRL